MSLLQKSPTRAFALPLGLKGESSDLESSADSEDDKVTGFLLPAGAKPQLLRKNTFYDREYEAVKVSNVPQTTEAWLFFMDLLKTEHRKFKLLLTHLRIERMKILKEFEAFTSAMQDATKMVQLQFEASTTNLRAVNVVRLLNGEINKRSSSYIKTTPAKQKRVSIGDTPTRTSTSPTRNGAVNSNVTSALASVREAFADFDDERDTDSFGDGFSDRYTDASMSVKLSTPSERLNRPRIPMEHAEDDKVMVSGWNLPALALFICSVYLLRHRGETNYARSR
jgi:hypothetical protein